jgi:hypothetical protein
MRLVSGLASLEVAVSDWCAQHILRLQLWPIKIMQPFE